MVTLYKSTRTCMIEGIIIGLSLALVPFLAIAVLVLFPEDALNVGGSSTNHSEDFDVCGG